MVSHTGPSGLTVSLLCCLGTLLYVYTAPISSHNRKKIIRELKYSSDRLLENYKREEGLPKSTYPLLPFAPYCRPPLHINSSAILPYFEAIEPLFEDKIDIEDIIQQLHKISFPRGPETQVPAPTVPPDSFQRKMFILAVLQEFSACLKSL